MLCLDDGTSADNSLSSFNPEYSLSELQALVVFVARNPSNGCGGEKIRRCEEELCSVFVDSTETQHPSSPSPSSLTAGVNRRSIIQSSRC